MRRAGTAGAARPWRGPGAVVGAPVDCAAMVGTDAAASAGGAGASGAAGAAAARSSVAASAGASVTAGGLACVGFSSRAAGAAGGLTAPAGGGATTTTGRAVVTAPAGGLATTAPDGGRLAMAGGAVGVAAIGAACRGCGTILRGSGRAGAAAATGGAAGAACTTGLAGCCRRGSRLCRHARVTRLFFLFLFLGQNGLHHIAGLGDVRKIDLGNDAWRAVAPRRRCACEAGRDSCPKCARTFSASSPSSELECVLPAATPSSGRMSRIARDFTSSSFARSLIRTLLIRLFSILCRQNALSCS